MAQTNVVLAQVANANQFIETALGTNANAGEVVKATAGTLYLVDVDNSANAAVTYVKAYYTAGAVTVGTTVPDEVWYIPASIRVSIPLVAGKAFASGMVVAAVTAGGTAGTTAPTSATIVRIIYT
jgi:hypothetical protein